MALWARKGLSRIASSVSIYEQCTLKLAKALSSQVNLGSSCDKDVHEITEDKGFLRKTFALLIGYKGTDYYGVCITPGQDTIPTIGKDIVAALVKSGYMDESDILSAKTLSQASRTDAGVSALRQVVSMQLSEDVDLDKVRPNLNDNIKIYGMIRAVKRFVPFRFCDERSYLYYIPSYVFSPQNLEMHKDYRLTSDTVEKIKRLLEKFQGIQNYHNFTRSRSYHDPRSQREITKTELLEPVIKDGFELACIRLVGKSFILNQIRKIVGALVTVVRGFAPEHLIDISLSQQGMAVGRAPPYGLMLENVVFEWYNNKFCRNRFSPIDFSEYEQEVEALKDRILAEVVATEVKYERTKLWVETLQYIPFRPYNKEQHILNSNLEYDETLTIIRSEKAPLAGQQAATLFI